MTHVINLDGEHLTLEDVIAVARHGAICEINQEAKKAVEAGDSDKVSDYANLLYDQALVLEGMPVEDPLAFGERICKLMK